MYLFNIIALMPLAAVAMETRLAALRQPLLCGEQQYNRTEYFCWSRSNGSSLLCPRDNGAYYNICGDECYFPYHYMCQPPDYKTLVPLPVRSTPFHIHAITDDQSLVFKGLQARNKRFYVGGTNDAFCSLSHGECPLPMKETIFNADGSLAVSVPGGQRTYIKTDGTMSFTDPQDSSKPNMLYESAGTAYEGGGFIGPNGTFWAACDDGTGAKYVVAAPGDETGAPDGCEKFNLFTMERPEGMKSAYQYSMEGRPSI